MQSILHYFRLSSIEGLTAGVTTMVTRLEQVAERHFAKSQKRLVKSERMRNQADWLSGEADRAKKIAAKFKDLVN